MKSLPNIEPSAFRRGEYVGYCNGVWIIRRTNSTYGNWIARKRDDTTVAPIYAMRLDQLSLKLTYAE